MAELTQTLADILTATFGPATAAEVMKDEAAEAAEASGSSPVGDDGAVGPSDLPHTSTAAAADAEVEKLAKAAAYAGDEDPYVKPRDLSGVDDDDDADETEDAASATPAGQSDSSRRE
jgi:hypothetical protein